MTLPRPIMRYHGGKWRAAPWIIRHLPGHRTYVEPFGGAASVLMQKPRSEAEVYNDLDDDIVNVMRVIRDPLLCEQLTQLLALTPYSRVEFKKAFEHSDDQMERARRTLIRAEAGFGSAGATKSTTGFRLDTKRNFGTAMQVWARIPSNLAKFCERLQGVLIENRPAHQVIADHDTSETLFYVDPPYVLDTRQMASRCYRHEMTDAQHGELLECLRNVQGMVVLSGYPHPIYDDMLKGWQRIERRVNAAGQRGSVRRTELLWLSPKIRNGGLFEHGSEEIMEHPS